MNPHADHRLIDSILWRILLPIGFVCLLFPIYKYLVGLSRPFELTFASGELIIVSVILFVEVSIELSYVENKSKKLYLSQNLAWFFAIGLIFAFGFLKYQALAAEHDIVKLETMKKMPADVMQNMNLVQDLESLAPLKDKLTGFSYLNLAIAFFTLVYGISNFFGIRSLELAKSLNEVTNTGDPAQEAK